MSVHYRETFVSDRVSGYPFYRVSSWVCVKIGQHRVALDVMLRWRGLQPQVILTVNSELTRPFKTQRRVTLILSRDLFHWSCIKNSGNLYDLPIYYGQSKRTRSQTLDLRLLALASVTHSFRSFHAFFSLAFYFIPQPHLLYMMYLLQLSRAPLGTTTNSMNHKKNYQSSHTPPNIKD